MLTLMKANRTWMHKNAFFKNNSSELKYRNIKKSTNYCRFYMKEQACRKPFYSGGELSRDVGQSIGQITDSYFRISGASLINKQKLY